MIDRRVFVIGAGAFAATACAGYPSEGRRASAGFGGLRAMLGAGGRLGVAALDTGTGHWLLHDENSRYAMASTFKWVLAAAILAEAERGALSLDDPVTFTDTDIISHSPTLEVNRGWGQLAVGRLCRAIVEVSDNGAANLLLALIGGPAGLTRFIRACGDPVTRLDRTELELNSNLPDDPRDTTSPVGMVGLMRSILVGDALGADSRSRLTGWMEASVTGRERLRAGLPIGWRVGDKTGTGANGAVNDIAIAWPPGRSPILIACYQSGGNADASTRNAVHTSVARAVASAFL